MTAAVRAAGSVRLSGDVARWMYDTRDGESVEISTGYVHQTAQRSGEPADVVSLGGSLYVKVALTELLRHVGVSDSVFRSYQPLDGQWVRMPANSYNFPGVSGTSLDSLADQLVEMLSGAANPVVETVSTDTVQGRPVVIVTSKSGTRCTIAAEGPPLPLLIDFVPVPRKLYKAQPKPPLQERTQFTQWGSVTPMHVPPFKYDLSRSDLRL